MCGPVPTARRPHAVPCGESSLGSPLIHARLILVLPDAPPGADTVAERLQHAAHPATGVTWPLRGAESDAQWSIRPVPAEPDEIAGLDAGEIGASTAEAVRHARWWLELTCPLPHGAGPLRFERLLQLARVAAPDALALIDPEAASVRSGDWLRETIEPGVPVRLAALYRIHAVRDEADACWLHTHGLARFGVPELEVLACPIDLVSDAGSLLRAVAHRCLVEGVPAPGEELPWGEGVSACLVPWRYAWADIDPSLGGPEERDELHGPDNRVIAAWQPTGPHGGRWRTVVDVLEALPRRPSLYLTPYETERLEALARLRWSIFSALARTFSEQAGWRFLAKFGYGGDDGDTRREHLWFEVHAADPAGADATLLNDPHQTLGLSRGDRARRPLHRLTDFRVVSPLGAVGPDDLADLLRRWREADPEVGAS